jgi:hypothetical protein
VNILFGGRSDCLSGLENLLSFPKKVKENDSMKKEIVGILLVLTLFGICFETIPLNAALVDKTIIGQLSQFQKFRLLAVEGYWSGGVHMKSAEYFVDRLIHFPNWNNITSTAYIQLLSMYSETEIVDECKRFYEGNATKFNVHRLISDFLGQASADELVVFYIITEGAPLELFLDETITAYELLSWFAPLRGTVCLIFDSCFSGSFIADGLGGTLGPSRIVLCSSLSNQSSWGKTEPYLGGDFTGFMSIRYPNGTAMPKGFIGATIAAEDINGDGWLSVIECFAYAQPSVQQFYPVDSKYHQDPVAYNGLSFDPPLVQLQSSIHDVAVTNITSKNVVGQGFSSSIDVTVENQGNFQELLSLTLYANTTAVAGFTSRTLLNGTSVTLAMTWNTSGFDYGNYTLTANVTPVPDEIDFADNNMTSWTIVTIPGDVDGNFRVQLNDLVLLAHAYSSRPGNSNWNPNADIDGNLVVGLPDLAILARNYGQQYP